MYKCILHPTDLQANHFSLCEKAKKLADFHKSSLYLIHVIEIPQTLLLAQNLGFAELIMPAKEDAQTVLKTIGDALDIPRNHQFVEIGMVKHHILERADKLKCDLIVMGKHASHSITNLMGSTTYHIMQHAKCDVLTLTNPGHDEAQKAAPSNKGSKI
jgi:nucleotide-binding universal stress UspA family protein